MYALLAARRMAILFASIMLIWVQPSFALDLVLIANPDSHIEHLTRAQVIDLYMGRNRKFPSGTIAMPIDLQTAAKEREQFYLTLVNKDLSQINSYWARLVFSGKAAPPFQATDVRTAIALVAANPSAIAYVDREFVNNQVKVVLELGH